jgi:aldehyde:ferredoxin oxidoreductase
VEGPEYETIALFGGNCALKTIEEVAYANYLCDELGIDTISAGVVIGWAIECFQKGILTREEIGRDIDFSDLETVIFLLGHFPSGKDSPARGHRRFAGGRC